MFIADERGEGVISINLAPQSLEETRNVGAFLKEQKSRALKYISPDICNLKFGTLTSEMKRILGLYINADSLLPEIKQIWNVETQI